MTLAHPEVKKGRMAIMKKNALLFTSFLAFQKERGRAAACLEQWDFPF